MTKLFFSLILLFVLTGCFDEASLELVDSDTLINETSMNQMSVSEEDISGTVTIFTLNYSFVLQNTGERTIGDMDEYSFADQRYLNGITVKIIPGEELEKTATELTGINFFEERERKRVNLPLGQTVEPELVSGQVGDYTLRYVLGTSEESTHLPVITVPDSQLEQLQQTAMEAKLVVYEGGQEIARFDLTE